MKTIPLNWIVGHSGANNEKPQEFVKASVPGAVQKDWAAAKNMPDWNRDVNFEEYRWMEDRFWVYRADIPKTALAPDEQLLFKCLGIDYKYDVYLDGEKLYAYEGMFRPFELDVGSAAESGGTLEIVIYPIPKMPGAEPGTRVEASACCKPAVSYGWDWHPRLVPSGIWDEATLRVAKKARILRAEVLYTLSEDLQYASINVNAQTTFGTDSHASALRFKLMSPDGAVALESDAFESDTLETNSIYSTELSQPLTLPKPSLWWCNGYGNPALYRWELTLVAGGQAVDRAEGQPADAAGGKVIDIMKGRIGFRKVSLEMNPGTWLEPEDFPKTRSRAPITLTLNNVPIFAKGSNWVNPEIFPGAMDEGVYRPLLKYARDANMNLLRVWGGGIVNKEIFFDICDEYGLMVWQEFPLACNKYPDDDAYLSVLESEASAIIARLRPHASHAIWCGGNELFNNWSLMTDQSLPLRLLNRLCYELDSHKPYLPTSPIDGMAHGCYLFVYPDGQEVYKHMAGARYTAYTEFGIPSVSNLDTCLAATDRATLFPLVKNAVTVAHHAFEAWQAEDTWCGIETLRRYFGEPGSIEQIIEWSQWLQCEGYKCIFEEARRQKPYCSMALNWCYNEPWPTIANNSLLNYPAKTKPAYYAVAQACRGALISARIEKFEWRAGDEFTAGLWLLNDGISPVPAGVADVWLEYCGERRHLLRWDYGEAAANQNRLGPTASHTIRGGAGSKNEGEFSQIKLIIEAGKMSSEYVLLLKH